MLAFNHSLAGSLVGVLVPAPLVPAIALVSHFVLDLTPHFGRSTTVYPYTKAFKIWLITDGILSVAAMLFAMILFPHRWFIIGAGAFFSVLPDLLWPFWHRGVQRLDVFLDWAERIQWGERPYGWIFDAFYGLMMCIALYLIAH